MNHLPGSTNIYKQMPKELFYKYLNSSSTLKKTFTDEIHSIIWTNTLSPETMTIQPGKSVKEIAVVEIVSKRQAINQSLLEILARETDPYTIFIVRYEAWGQIWCCDQAGANNPEDPFKYDSYYQTSWFPYDDLKLKVIGQDLDQVYANIFFQITGKPFSMQNESREKAFPEKERDEKTALAEETMLSEKIKNLEATVKELETKIDHEKQFSRQLKLNGELLSAREEIKKIRSPRMTHMEIRPPQKKEPPPNSSENMRTFFPNVFLNMKDGAGNRFDYRIG